MSPVAAAQALFASPLQPSDHPTPEQVRAAVRASLRAHSGVAGCVAVCATEYGDHPETAAARMRWALALVAVPVARAA